MLLLNYQPLRDGIRNYKQSGRAYAELRRLTGNAIAESTIGRIASGENKEPRLSVWLALHQAAPEFIPAPPLLTSLQLDNSFRAAMDACLSKCAPEGKSRLARALGVTTDYIVQILNGQIAGSEMHRRRVAEFFGYSNYDEFLRFGYKVLAEERADPQTPPLSPAKREVVEAIKLLDDSQVEIFAGMLRAMGKLPSQAQQAGADNQAGRAKAKPGKRLAIIDESPEIGIIELPGDPIKNSKK